MTNVQINCPTCSKNGIINVSNEFFKNLPRGILAVNITENYLCSHSFIAYVDKNHCVRDYFMADFQVDLPNISIIKGIKEEEIPGPDFIDTFLIKNYLSAMLLSYILKPIFYKKKIVMIFDEIIIKNNILNFFKYITQESFTTDISIISKERYNKDKKKYKEFMVFEGNKILRNVNNIINPKKLKIEKSIVQKFMFETNLPASLIILKNEIQKIYILSNSIVAYLNNKTKKQTKIHPKNIINHLNNIYNTKISDQYYYFLRDIVEAYFNVEINEVSSSIDFLDYI